LYRTSSNHRLLTKVKKLRLQLKKWMENNSRAKKSKWKQRVKKERKSIRSTKGLLPAKSRATGRWQMLQMWKAWTLVCAPKLSSIGPVIVERDVAAHRIELGNLTQAKSRHSHRRSRSRSGSSRSPSRSRSRSHSKERSRKRTTRRSHSRSSRSPHRRSPSPKEGGQGYKH